MEVVLKFLTLMVAAFITLGAVSLSFESNHLIDRAYEKQRELQENPSLVKKLTIPEETTIFGSEIVNKLYLYYGQNLQITIDAHTYDMANDDITEEDFALIIDVVATYQETIERDTEGKLTKITYSKEVL